MVVGFVNSGLMTLKQAINVIMGANIGTTVTAWLLSLGGIESDNLFIQLLKPTSFTPVLALIGIGLHMFSKSDKKKEIGTIFLGFATLMFGMDAMSDAVSGLRDVPQFQEALLLRAADILNHDVDVAQHLFWDQIFREVGARYPDVETHSYLVDAASRVDSGETDLSDIYEKKSYEYTLVDDIVVLSTIEDGTTQEYSVEILKIYPK